MLSIKMKTIILAFVLCAIEGFHSIPVNEHGKNPMENPNLWGGDMLGFDLKGNRNAIPKDSLRWPGGIIYYAIGISLKNQVNLIHSAMDHIESKTCIKFVARPPSNRDYVHFTRGADGCYSEVGRAGGQQILSLGDGCHYFHIAVHEMVHAIGFDHEQNRSDRDKYLRIRWENIKSGMEDQFTLLKPHENRIYNGFDFDGVMLYGPTAFSKNGRATMESITPGKRLHEENLNAGLTESDAFRINKLYGCQK